MSEPTYQEKIIEAISKGDLESFRKLYVGKFEIDRRLIPYQDLRPISKTNPDSHYLCPRGPTILMFAVLCERPDVVENLLESKYPPDLSLVVEGFTAFHYSVITKDHSCFDLLLSCEYYQENINQPVDLPNVPKPEDMKEKNLNATALHIAVSHRNYYCVVKMASINHFPTEAKYKATKEQEETEAKPPPNPIDINTISISGSSALHIAVYIKDLKMVKLLCALGIDVNLKNSSDKTPMEYAIELDSKEKNDKRLKEIIDFLGSEDYPSLDEVIIDCCPELIAKEEEVIEPKLIDDCSDDEDETIKMKNEQVKKESIKEIRQEVNELNKKISIVQNNPQDLIELKKTLEDIMNRLATLENVNN